MDTDRDILGIAFDVIVDGAPEPSLAPVSSGPRSG
jgi:hypothetical protein